MNRALRAVTTGVLLLSPVALTACSAGQVTQTATQDRDKYGAQADVGDLALRDVRLTYPLNGAYEEGGDARLVMGIANGSDTDDTLVSVTGEGFEGVEVVPAAGGDTAAQAAAGDAAAGGEGTVDVPVPANSITFVGQGDGAQVTLTGLAESLTPAQTLDVTFEFEQAGEVTVPVLVGTPLRDLPRQEAFDFHEGEEGPDEAAREREAEAGGDEGNSGEE